MEYQSNASGGQFNVKLKGEFTFADNQQFQGMVTNILEQSLKHITLDFSGLEFIDSAALSMLLVMRDSCDKKHKKLTICNSAGRVKEVLDEMKFSKFIRVQN